ncbi:hypothetical protein ACWDRB_47185 [Nonomuraea sp. NPDC003707]
MPIVAPITLADGSLLARPTYVPAPGIRHYLLEGSVVPIPARAMPLGLGLDLDGEPIVAVITHQRLWWGIDAYTAIAPVHQAPHMSLRWDAETGQAADVACWQTPGEALIATSNLATSLSSRAEHGKPFMAVTIVDNRQGERRVVGPDWGGTLFRHGRDIHVHADFSPNRVGMVRSYRAGARKLAQQNGAHPRHIRLDETF